MGRDGVLRDEYDTVSDGDSGSGGGSGDQERDNRQDFQVDIYTEMYERAVDRWSEESNLASTLFLFGVDSRVGKRAIRKYRQRFGSIPEWLKESI